MICFRHAAAFALLFVFLCGPDLSAWAGPDEPGLAEFWRKHEKYHDTSMGHAEIAAQGDIYLKHFPDSPFAPVARGIAAWHLLSAGQVKDAAAVLNAMLADAKEPIAAAGDQMAKRWLTRLDRELVETSLHAYFGDNVVYPESLHVFGELPAASRPPMGDRWGRAWKYSLANYKHLPKARQARYIIESGELGALSDLQLALKAPYAGSINLRPVSIMAGVPGLSSVQFETTGAKPVRVVLTENSMYERRITFVRMTSSFILLTDGDHWLLTPPPSR